MTYFLLPFRASILAALLLTIGCDSVELPPRVAEDPAAPNYVPSTPRYTQARLSYETSYETVVVEWSNTSNFATGFEIEQSLDDGATFSVVGRVDAPTVRWEGPIPEAFAAQYRVVTTSMRDGTDRRSTPGPSVALRFFDPSTVTVRLAVLDERALHVGFDRPVRASGSYRVNLRRFDDGVLAREVTIPFADLRSASSDFVTSQTFSGFYSLWVDSLDVRQIPYRYEARFEAGTEQGPNLVSNTVTPPPTFPANVGVFAQMLSSDQDQRQHGSFTYQIIFPLPRLGTSFTVVRVSDLGDRNVTFRYTRNEPPPPGYTPFFFRSHQVGELDKARSYTFEAIARDGSRIGRASAPLRYDSAKGLWVI